MNRLLVTAAAIAGALSAATADEVQLRDKSAVIGRIIAEKPDQVFVDIGYTVIGVPRAQIVKVVKADEKSTPSKIGRAHV